MTTSTAPCGGCVRVDGIEYGDRAWTYPEPYPAAIQRVGRDLSDYVAFWKEVRLVDEADQAS